MTCRQTMVSKKRRKEMLNFFIFYLSLLSLAIALMPAGNALKGSTKILMYCSGTGSWIGLIGTIYMALRINHNRKGSYRFHELNGDQKQLGLTHFFKNREAIIIDSLMFISIISVIIVKLCNAGLQLLFVFFALFVFSFGMHCMLNGINYKYLKYKVRRDEES